MMIQTINRIGSILIGCVLISTLVSCGGSSDSQSTATTQGRGTVGILLTDKPADPSLFSAINLSIVRVELLGSEDNGKVTLYSGDPITADLLKLKNEAIPFAFNDDVPAGEYCKIRLILDDLELVLADDTPDDDTDNETDHPHLPGNGKLDLVARDCFMVEAGQTVTIQLDMDAGNSIHVNENKKGFKFRPVVFVDVLSQDFDSKLLRISGEITEIDATERTLLLCKAIPVRLSDDLKCAKVYLGDNSAFFDNLTHEGAPRSLDELLIDDKIGQQATVVGWPRFKVKPHVVVDIPDGHLPPRGECRLWQIGVEPGQQPPPGNCDELANQVSENTILVDHNGQVKDRHHPLLALDALVVELGEFLLLEGEVATDADTDGFSMNVTSSEPIIIDGSLEVVFQPGEMNINGTRFVSKSGKLVDSTQIIVPRLVQVDGVLDLTGVDDLLKAALVIVDTGIQGSEQVTGSVLSVGLNSLTLSPENDTVCGIATTELVVALAENIEILTVIITDTGSEVIPGGDVLVGQTIGMNGVCENDSYSTDNLVIVDDQRL